jgi:hypothetical protein
MSYNWISAATPQGRKRLKELVENDKQIVIREKGVISVASIAEDGCLIFGRFEYDNWEDVEINEMFDDLEFLDPEPTAPVVDENGLLPCPFCGGKAATKADNVTAWEVIIETGCHDCRIGFCALSNINEKDADTIATNAQWNERTGRGIKG